MHLANFQRHPVCMCFSVTLQWDAIQNQILVVIWFLSALGQQLCLVLEPLALLLCGEEAASVGKRAQPADCPKICFLWALVQAPAAAHLHSQLSRLVKCF